MNSDGTAQSRLTDASGADYSGLVWSPDGSNITFDSNGEIFTMEADGTSQTNISSNSAWDEKIDWGP